MVAVSGYVRADGTKVRPYTRWAAGARSEMTKLVLFALVVLGFGGAAGTAATTSEGGSGELPKPKSKSTAVYPVKFPGWDNPQPRPTPTVSYPIQWDRGE